MTFWRWDLLPWWRMSSRGSIRSGFAARRSGNKAGWTKFCGMELKWDEDGETLRVAQPSYISELMQRHEVVMAKPAPFYKPEVPENPVVTQDGIREAQGLVGELLWVSVRTRPDVAFGVSWMSQHVTRYPLEVVKAGKDMMAYLYGTKDLGLVYGRCLSRRRSSFREIDEAAGNVRGHLFCAAGREEPPGSFGILWWCPRPMGIGSTAFLHPQHGGGGVGGLHRGHDHGRLPLCNPGRH